MTCLPSQSAIALAESDGLPAPLSRAERLLASHRRSLHALCEASADGAVADAAQLRSAAATALMDVYRETGSREVFEALVEVAMPQLQARVRSRLRTLGSALDPQEVLQDTLVNVYRYPDRFLASRPGAFAAWSSTIVDNVIRRSLRQRGRTEVVATPIEMLLQATDHHAIAPDRQAAEHEELCATARAYTLLLQCYLAAVEQLSDRERYVLHMVEVRQMRYLELAGLLSIRPEALKMVVFRARRRVYERIALMLAGQAAAADACTAN